MMTCHGFLSRPMLAKTSHLPGSCNVWASEQALSTVSLVFALHILVHSPWRWIVPRVVNASEAGAAQHVLFICIPMQHSLVKQHSPYVGLTRRPAHGSHGQAAGPFALKWLARSRRRA